MMPTWSWALAVLLIFAFGVWIGSALPRHGETRDDCE